MTFQTEISDGTFEEVLFFSFMRVMAFVASANGNGTVHELLFERGAVMTPHAEICPVLAHVQEKPPGSPVWLVAGNTVTLFYRLVHYLLLSKSSVALCAERRYLGRQFEAFFTF